MMTVEELITELQKHSKDKFVFMRIDGGYEDYIPMEIESVRGELIITVEYE
jgi:hypothetical protein